MLWAEYAHNSLQSLSTGMSTVVGPFEVERNANSVSSPLHLGPSMKVHSMCHVSLLKPVNSGPVTPVLPPPPLTRPVGGRLAVTVQCMSDSHLVRGQMQYLVDRQGYGT